MFRRYLLILCLVIPAFAADQPISRESGNLATGQYKNPYYGFGLVLPSANKITRREFGEQPRGIHALLAMKFERVYDQAALTIFATDATSGRTLDPHQAADEQVKECQRQGMSWRQGPSELINTGKAHEKIPPGINTFYVAEFNTPTGEIMTYLFFSMKNELITVVGAASSRKAAGTDLDPWWVMPEYFRVNSPVEINYNGPAPIAANVIDLTAAKPGTALPADMKISGNLFSSAAVGLRYGFPQGWKTAAEAQDPFAQYHPEPKDAAARASHDLLKSCSRTVLQLVDAGPAMAAEPATLSLLVADPACLHLKLPDMTNVDQLSGFASQLAQYSDFGQVANAGLLNDSGRSFVELQGKINDKNGKPGRSQVAFVTPHNNFLVLFFFTANDASQIDILPNSGLSFDPEKK